MKPFESAVFEFPVHRCNGNLDGLLSCDCGEERKDDGVKDARVTQRRRRQMELKVGQESLREGRAAGLGYFILH